MYHFVCPKPFISECLDVAIELIPWKCRACMRQNLNVNFMCSFLKYRCGILLLYTNVINKCVTVEPTIAR